MSDIENLIQQLVSAHADIVKGCEDHWILMVPSSIGELATACALLPAFRERHGGKICLVVDSSKRAVLEPFSEQIDVIKFVPLGVQRALSNYGVINPLEFKIGLPQNLWINQNGDGRGFSLHQLLIDHPGRGGLSFPDMYRYAMKLPWDSRITLGEIRADTAVEARIQAELKGVEPGNSVVFFTGNNSNKPAPTELWNSLAREYRRAGKKVFFNSQGGLFQPKGLDLDGPQLGLSSSVALGVCEIAGHMVSCANGLVLMALMTKTSFGIDVLLTDGVCTKGVGDFQPANPQIGSTFLVAPELVTGISRPYREWIAIEGAEDLPEIAQAIVAGSHVMSAAS